MIKFLLIAVAVLIVALIVFFFLWRLSVAKRKEQKEEIVRLTKQLCLVCENNSKLEQTIDILKNNREAADEKIDSLHNGDSVSNALDELHKHKN